MMALQEPFMSMLSEQLYVEQQLVETLPKLQSEAGDSELTQNLQHHLEETREHVNRLEDAFRALGQEPKPKKSAVLDDLEKKHEKLMSETPKKLRDAVIASSAAATEHNEIAAYDALICAARAIGQKDVVELLEQNLSQEQEALQKAQKGIEKITKEHSKELVA